MVRTVSASRGFTLLEVLVATVIVGLSLTAIAGLMSQIIRTASVTERYNRAVLLAQSKLDELTVRSFEQGNQSGEFAEDPGYAWSLTTENAKEEGLKKIKITVTFQAPGGKREVVLNTFHADRTLQKTKN